MYSGGGERTAIYEAILLRHRGHEATVFAPAIRRDVCFPDLINQIRLQSIIPKTKVKLPFRDFLSLTASSLLAPLAARKFEDFDVILSHGQPATWISYLITRQLIKPHVTYLHQATRFLHPREIDLKVGWKTKPDFELLENIVQIARPPVQAIDHVSVVSSDRVLVNSRWVADTVRRFYEIEPGICPPGVDVTKFKPVTERHDLTIDKHHISRPFILSTNRHYPQKGLSDLIRIYAEVRRNFECELVVTGGFTPYTAHLKQLTVDLGLGDHVFFTGQVAEEDLVRLNQNADVYAFTSPEEDFGLGPIEAMASGTPPVVWDNAGPAETVVEGLTGMRARPADLHDFAEKLTIILANPKLRRSLSREGAAYVRRKYSWEKHVDTLLENLNLAVEAHRGRKEK
jgi:glycosyltransferase involved in cell wall biosynthesis